MAHPSMLKDVYKEFHVRAYHPLVSEVYTNYVSRSGKYSNTGGDFTVFVGLQMFMLKHLIEDWNKNFFALTEDKAVARHQRTLSAMLGYPVNVMYLRDLHRLGYLPLEIKALPEGTFVPYQVTPFTVRNTVEGFQWLPNMIETVMSCENWGIQTSATTAVHYYATFLKYARETGLDEGFVPFQGHDFSMRGMFGVEAATLSGLGHLMSGLVGTDTIPAVLAAEDYYGADVTKELVGCSVDATEHSVTCSWQEEGEIAFFRYLMQEQSPKGILSIVSDTWDFWKLVTEFLPAMKEEIMARDGTVVIRPDSGDPVLILCGDPQADTEWERKGLIECLWDTFGGTVTDKGYKVLDSHIGAIYGDSITLERQRLILQRLKDKGFASKVVLGIGSYTYQYVTRDTHGSAVKAISVVKNGVRTGICKEPKTDTSKKSAKGLLRIEREDGKLVQYDNQTEEQEKQGLLQTVFLNSKLVRTTTLQEIRSLIKEQIDECL